MLNVLFIPQHGDNIAIVYYLLQKQSMDTDWFKLRLEIQNLSQRKLAKMIGMDQGAFSLMIRGKRKMRLEEANAIAQALNVPTTEVIRASGISSVEGVRHIPVVGYIGTDSVVEMDTSHPIGNVPAPPDMPPGSYALQFKPGYPGGFLPDALAFFSAPQGVSLDALQRLAIIKDKAGRITCSFLRRGISSGTFSTNDGPVELEWASPVLWIKT